MTVQKLRELYLNFMKEKGHVVIPSASLLPENDPTTLFTGSGMQPMVPYLLGQKHPEGTRITDSQKSFRSGDIEEVGDNRHTTFFEMLGNWSLGDYFKDEHIRWMFEFLTEVVEIDPKYLYVTAFRGNEELGIARDEESVTIWKELFESKNISADSVDFSEENGMQGGRIFYYDETKNWWSRAGVPGNMPNGEPGGPDTEMFWDFGSVDADIHERSEFKDAKCHVNCDCGRFLEIGNNVFMEYLKTEKGFEKLPQRNVDFGGGLERLVAAKNMNPDVFMIDVFDFSREKIELLSGKKYGDYQVPFRIIMDHLRAATFLIADGAIPSNKDQGYFTRRLIRRAIRLTKELGVEENIAAQIVESFIDSYKTAYPELEKNKENIIVAARDEEVKFKKTLEKGLKQLKLIGEDATTTISGTQGFELFSTYGFPIELSREVIAENNFKIRDDFDQEFEVKFKEHQNLSRETSQAKFKGGLADHSDMSVKYHTATHLLHRALKNVLGDHVEQKGSNITPERLRFDFTHSEKMTPEQKQEVEKVVNNAIQENLSVSWGEMTVDEAKTAGAIGLFGDKYGDRVKVYSIGDFSKEMCGGPHVEHTEDMGTFKIKKEGSASAGVRRIKAVLE